MSPFRTILVINGLCIAALISFVAVVGPLVRTLGLAEWHGGLVVTIAGALWVASARGWGRLSDLHGRKRVLLWSSFGFAVTFLALARYFDLAQRGNWSFPALLALLIFIRGSMGLFYAAIPVASVAWLADHFPAEQRRGVMAKLGAANAAGMVLGPLAAGLLAEDNLSYPMYLASVLPLCASLLLWLKVPASVVQPRHDGSILGCIDSRIRLPLIAMFLAYCTIFAAQMCVGFYAMDHLALDVHAGARVAGQTMATVGLILVVVQLALASRNRISPRVLIAVGALLAGIGFSSVLLISSASGLMASYGIAATGMGMLIPSAHALAANSVETHEQGLAAGTLSAAQGMASVVSPVLFMLLYQWHRAVPYMVAGGVLALLFLYALVHSDKIDHPPAPDPIVGA